MGLPATAQELYRLAPPQHRHCRGEVTDHRSQETDPSVAVTLDTTLPPNNNSMSLSPDSKLRACVSDSVNGTATA